MSLPELDKVVFLDRDGVINQDSPDYIKSWAEIKFIPGSREALCRLTEAGFSLILISNQSAVGRNMITVSGLEYIFTKLKNEVRHHGGKITAVFYCPHLPQAGCNCRKPLPGLIEAACDRYVINRAAACMIGDSSKDIECGLAADCGYTVLVKTGNGVKAEQELRDKNIFPSFIASNLLTGARWLITIMLRTLPHDHYYRTAGVHQVSQSNHFLHYCLFKNRGAQDVRHGSGRHAGGCSRPDDQSHRPVG